MSDQKKRVIVDGVEFGELFFFPRVLGSVTSSLQLPRLVIALFMVVALVTGGRLWDSTIGASVPAVGLTAEQTAEQLTAQDELLRNALKAFRPFYVPRSEGGNQEEDTWLPRTRKPKEVLADIQAGYTSDRDEARPDLDEYDAEYQNYRRQILSLLQGPYEAMSDEIVTGFHGVVQGVVYLDARSVFENMGHLCIDLPRGLWTHARAFTIVYGLFALLVLAIGGGALSRMAAVQVAGQERMRIRNAVDFALGNWIKLLLAPMLPLIILFFIGLVLAACGVLLNIPVLNVIAGFGYIVLLLLGLLLTFLLLCYAVGFPMLIPAVACENCDAGDAMTRTFNYILVRPLHFVGYAITAIVGMAVGFIVVAFFAVLTLKATGTLVGLFTSSLASTQVATDISIFNLDQGPSVEGDWDDTWAANGIAFWQMIVISLVGAYVFSYFFSASTTVYLLMRRACDGQDVEEIWWPGLMPGTLAPMPRTRVEFAGGAIAESIELQGGGGDDDAEDDDSTGADDDHGSKSPASSSSTPAKKSTKKKAKSKKKAATSKKKAASRKKSGDKKKA